MSRSHDDELDELQPPDFTGFETPELVVAAIRADFSFKDVAEELAKRPPNRSAAERVIDAYRRGEARPWLVALLLGQCRELIGYAIVREILLAAPRQLAESYAGEALAHIKGAEATTDLVEILMTAPERRSREGAGYGLAIIGSPEAATAVLQAALAGKITGSTAGGLLGRLISEETVVLELLQSGDRKRLALGTEIIWSCLLYIENRPGTNRFRKLISQPSTLLRAAVESALADPKLEMRPKKRKGLTGWLGP